MKKSSPGSQPINISEFKAKALRLIDETSRSGKEFVILRKGVPVARVTPVSAPRATRRGALKGMIEIRGDIVQSDFSEDWELLKK